MKYIFVLLAFLGTGGLRASASEDKQAIQIMQKVAAKYRTLHTLSATLVWTTRLGNETPGHSTSNVLLQKPNLLMIKNHTDGSILVSNGKKQWLYNPTDPQYVKTPTYVETLADPHGKNLMSGTDLVTIFFDPLIYYADPFKFGKPSWRYRGKRWFHHRQYHVVQCVLTKPWLSRQTLYIGSDYLIYRDQLYCDPNGGTATYADVTMTHPLLDVPLPKATFDFKPPANAKPTTLLGTPLPSDAPDYDPALVPGKLPAAINVRDLAGKQVSLADYEGKVVLLDYWTTWCAPCVAELPAVAALYKKYHAQGLEIVSISLDDDQTPAGLTTFAKKHGMTWRQVYDGKDFLGPLAAPYKINAIPFTLLIGRDGKIAAVALRDEKLDAAVQAALLKK